MFTKLSEVKVLRDPIHGYVHIDLQVIWELLNTKEFQRLRRIRQLGGAFAVYHTAMHTRFEHSLGVYEIVRRMVVEIEDLNHSLTEYEKVCVMVAGLLHDVGHFPYSHAFESIVNCNHEEFTQRILLEDTQIHSILMQHHPSLAKDVCDIINHSHPNKILTQIISSQLDADRMDYLLRDSYFTGTKYGQFDLERLLRTIRVKQEQLVIKESGMHTVEDYIMARYHMYWQVYLHPVARSFEVMLQCFFARLKDVYLYQPEVLKGITMFDVFLQEGTISVEDHFLFDEHACNYGIMCLRKVSDPILADLAKALLDRKLFGYVDANKETMAYYKKCLEEAGYDSRYYLRYDQASKKPYQPYIGSDIYILVNKQIQELSQTSNIVSAIVKAEVKKESLLFGPKELLQGF